MKLKFITLSLVSIFLGVISVACNSLENDGGKDWVQVRVTVDQPGTNTSLRSYSAGSVQSAAISAVPVSVTQASYDAINSGYDTQMQNLITNTITLSVPLNEPIKLLKAAYTGVYTLDDVVNSQPSPYALGFSEAFTVTGTDTEKTITIAMTTSESWEGIVQYGTASSFEYGTKVVVAPDGPIYVAGGARGALDGLSNASVGTDDAFLTKFSADGTKLWTRMFGSTLSENVEAATVDSSGNIYLTGSTSGEITGATTNGSYDAFLVKYDSSGEQIFVKQFGSASVDSAEGVAIGSDNMIYLAGWTMGTMGSPATYDGSTDIFIMRTDLNGENDTVLLQEDITDATGDSQTAEKVFDMVMDSSDNIYLTGSTIGSYVSGTTPEAYDTYLGQYNTSGTRTWATQLGGVSGVNDIAAAVAVDGNGGVYVAFMNTVDNMMGAVSNQGGTDIVVVKYTPDVNSDIQFFAQLGSSVDDQVEDMVVSSEGYLYIVGYTAGDISLPTAATNNGGTAQFGDILVAKYDTNCTLDANKICDTAVWVKLIGTSADEAATSVALDSSGNLLITGVTMGSLDGTSTADIEGDIFLIKLDPDGNVL